MVNINISLPAIELQLDNLVLLVTIKIGFQCQLEIIDKACAQDMALMNQVSTV